MQDRLYDELTKAVHEAARQHDARQTGRHVSGRITISLPLFDALMTDSLAMRIALRRGEEARP